MTYVIDKDLIKKVLACNNKFKRHRIAHYKILNRIYKQPSRFIMSVTLHENVCWNLGITAKAICYASQFYSFIFIYSSDLWESVRIHNVLTFSRSSFTSFFNWSTSIFALSKSVRFSTSMTGIFCEKNKCSFLKTALNATHYCQSKTSKSIDSVTKFTLTAACAESSSPWWWTKNPSALSQSGL